MKRRFRIIVAVGLCVGLLAPAQSAAASLTPPVADCNVHNKLTRHYPASELENALSTMPSDISEYTDCYDVIQQQLLAEIGHAKLNGSGGGSGGSFLPTPVIVVLAVLALAALALGGVALARRRPPAP